MSNTFKRIRFEDMPNARDEGIYLDNTIVLSKDAYFKLYTLAELAENMMSKVDDYLDEQLGLK